MAATKSIQANEAYSQGRSPHDKRSHNKKGMVKIQALDPNKEKSITVPWVDYSKVNPPYIEFG